MKFASSESSLVWTPSDQGSSCDIRSLSHINLPVRMVRREHDTCDLSNTFALMYMYISGGERQQEEMSTREALDLASEEYAASVGLSPAAMSQVGNSRHQITLLAAKLILPEIFLFDVYLLRKQVEAAKRATDQALQRIDEVQRTVMVVSRNSLTFSLPISLSFFLSLFLYALLFRV
jgi:hypothetical protein